MKMNKTMLLGEVANRSGIPADECGVVLKTFEEFFAKNSHGNCTVMEDGYCC